MSDLINEYIRLSNESIAATIERTYSLGRENKADETMLKRTALYIEEIMLNFQEAYGVDTELHFSISKRYSTLKVLIEQSGDRMNPLDAAMTEHGGFIMEEIGVSAKYSYVNGVNRVGLGISIDNGRSALVKIFGAIILGLLIGVFGKYLPEGIFDVVEVLFTKTTDAIFGLITMVATPVIFLCVIQGIVGSGNLGDFKKYGKLTIKSFFTDLFFMLLFTVCIAIPVLHLNVSLSSTTEANSSIIIDSLFSIIPNNMVQPFADGDNLKVVVLGVILGATIIALKDRMITTINVVHEIKTAFSFILEFFINLVPVLIVVLVASNIWAGNFSPNLLELWKPILLYFMVIIIILVFNTFRMIRSSGHSFKEVMQILLPISLKAILTASSMMCYSDMEKALIEKLDIPEEHTNFALSMSVAIFQPAMVVFSIIVIYFMADSGATVSLGWIISLMLVCYMVAIAVPPVCCAGVPLMLTIFTALGVPNECCSIAIPIIMLADYPHTGWRVALTVTEVANTYFKKVNKQGK